MVEVKSIDTNPTKLPEVEPIYAGKLDTSTTRCFDLFCVGKYEQGGDLKLNIRSADEIPDLVIKNANGDPVFAEPKPMCTIQGLRGHNVWINVELKTISTKASGYMCLGIKKQGEDDYFDILYTGNMSRYVDVMESDTVELIPLVSSTPLSTKYTPVKPGNTAKITSEDAYDFGSVYRVHISPHEGQWIADQKCDFSTTWHNYGRMGIGSVTDQKDNVHENQLFSVCSYSDGGLAYSSDGVHWTKNGAVFKDGDEAADLWVWTQAPIYGNGIWCVISRQSSYGVRRSADGGKTWSETLANIYTDCLQFADNIFMCVTLSNPGKVYTPPDAEIWTQISSINFTSGEPSILIYGNDKWVCGSNYGYICQSKDGKTWEQFSDVLYKMTVEDGITVTGYLGSWWLGGCYANGYFYVIRGGGVIARSPDGVKWKRVFSFDIGDSVYCNITYYKNKLWAFAHNGQKYTVGLFNPDGTIDSLEN